MEYNESITTRTITLTIDGRSYQLSVAKGDETMEMMLRKSAGIMNSLIEQKRRTTSNVLTDERDIVVLGLLTFVYMTLSNEMNISKKNEQLENSIMELKKLNFKLEEIIESFNKLNDKE